MKRWFGVFSVLIMLFSFVACAGHYIRWTEQQEQAIEELNQSLPKRVDPVTTLKKVTHTGSALTYHYVVDTEASAIPKKHWQRTLEERTVSACDNENKKYFNVVFGVFDCIFYDYRDKDGEMLVLARIDKNTCN